MSEEKVILKNLFLAAVDAALPKDILEKILPSKPNCNRMLVVGAGKAAASMASALEKIWDDCEGIVITRHGHNVGCENIRVVEAGHPIPDENGLEATKEILKLAANLGRDDVLIALISGGASSLLSLGFGKVSMEDKRSLTKQLLTSGASIVEMNVVRKHISAIKGGRLAEAAYPARVITINISDVPGDNPADIGSGPTVPDNSTQKDAKKILKRYSIEVLPSIMEVLNDTKNETLKSQSLVFRNSEIIMAATPQKSLLAASKATNIPTILLGDIIEGEAREVGRAMGGIAVSIRNGTSSFKAPCILLSGGETTVTITKDKAGRGGRNVEFLMGLAEAVQNSTDIFALACDTDGIDGSVENAGAFIDCTTAQRAEAIEYPLAQAMNNFDGHGLFEKLGDAIVTGPTLTNVNDFRAIYIKE